MKIENMHSEHMQWMVAGKEMEKIDWERVMHV